MTDEEIYDSYQAALQLPGGGGHPALTPSDPGHEDAQKDYRAALQRLGENFAEKRAASAKPASRSRNASTVLGQGETVLGRGYRGGHDLAEQRRKDERANHVAMARFGPEVGDKIDVEMRGIIDAARAVDADGKPVGLLAQQFQDPAHPDHKKALTRVQAAYNSMSYNRPILHLNETVEEQRARFEREQEEAQPENRVVRFDETIEPPRGSEPGDELLPEEWSGLGMAAARDGVSTSIVSTVLSAFQSSKHYPDADDNALRVYWKNVGKDFHEEVRYADAALKWLDANSSPRIRARLRQGIAAPAWGALAIAGRAMAGEAMDRPILVPVRRG